MKTIAKGCLIVFCSFVILFTLFVFGFFSIRKSVRTQQQKIAELPEITGTIITTHPMTSPAGTEDIAMTRFEIDYRRYYSQSSGRDGQSHRVNVFSPEARIVIDQKEYTIIGHLEDAYLYNLERGKNWDNLFIQTHGTIIDDYYHGLDEILDSALSSFGFHGSMGRFEAHWRYESCSFRVQEFYYYNGDSIRAKGIIDGDSVVLYSFSDIDFEKKSLLSRILKFFIPSPSE